MNNFITEKFRHFLQEKGVNYNDLEKSERESYFEHFSAYVVLRNWHLDDMEPDQTQPIVIGGQFDHQIDSVAVVMNNKLILTAEQFEKEATDPDADDGVKLIFIQSTVTERFDLHKMQVFVNGVEMFVNNETFFQANEELQRKRELFAAILDQFPDEEKDAIQIFMYFVAMPDGDKEDLISQWRAWSESNIRKSGFQNITAEGINERRFALCLDRIDVQKGLKSSQPSETYQRSLDVTTLMKVPSPAGGNGPSFIGCFNAGQLISLLESEDGQGLLDSVFIENVRGFQGMNGVVNKAIGDTVINSDARSQFFVRNNGVTIVAENAQFQNGRLTLENYQIVNGLQTSHVLYNHRSTFEKSEEEILVPIKIVVTNDVAIKDAIIESTNLQTKIGEVEFLSRRPIIRRIEARMSDLRGTGDGPDLWLERRPGQFDSYPEIPSLSTISARDLMMVYVSVFLDYPHEAKSGPARVIKRVPSQIFAEHHSVETYRVAAWILHLVRSYCRSEGIPRQPNLEWHLAFGIRHYLYHNRFPKKGDRAAIDAFSTGVKATLTNTAKIKIGFDECLEIVRTARKGPSRGASNTDFLALSKSTAFIKRQINKVRGDSEKSANGK